MMALAAHNLSLYLDENDSAPLFSFINIQLKPGKLTLLLGPSGSGKSSLALCLNGIYPHAIEGVVHGEVLLEQKSLSSMNASSIAKHVGIVFQDPDSQFCMLKVEDELAFCLENIGTPAHQIDTRINEALTLVALEKYRYANIESLSGGMKQRLSIACALALQPKVLILDEPTSNLDPISTKGIAACIDRLKQEYNIAVLLIEHQLDAWMPYVDQLAVLGKEGTFDFQGDAVDYFSNHVAQAAKLGIWMPTATTLHEELQLYCDSKCKTVIEAEAPLHADELFEKWIAMPASIRNHALQYLNRNRSKMLKQSKKTSHLPPLLELDEISFARKSRKFKNNIINNISLCIPQGEFIALVGPNGAGKSTLAGLMSGLLKPTQGEIKLNTLPLQHYPELELRQMLGLIFQHPEHQFVTESVYDELAFSMREQGLNESSIHERVIGLLEQYRLSQHRHATPFSLSEGQKRRLSVAAMLSEQQGLLICDEPTYGQDQFSTQEIMDALNLRVSQGMSVFMITHDIEIVEQYCHRVIVLNQGKIAFDGPTSQLWQLPNEQLAYYHLSKPISVCLAQQLEAMKNKKSSYSSTKGSVSL